MANDTVTRAAFGNPILAPMNSQTCDILTGKHGQLQVRTLPDADTFGLFYQPTSMDGETTGVYDPTRPRDWTLLACHPNGHICKNLGERILAAWEGKGDGARAVDQFDYILRCGGLGRSLETILHVIRGP